MKPAPPTGVSKIICYADVNRDGVVDVEDMRAVAGASCKPVVGVTPCCDCPSGFQSQFTADTDEGLIQLVLASNLSATLQAEIIQQILLTQ